MDRKEGWKDLSYKEKLSYILCIVSFVTSIVLIFTGLFIPPPGEITASALTGCGIFLAFCGSLIGIHTHFETQLATFERKILDKLNDKDEN